MRRTPVAAVAVSLLLAACGTSTTPGGPATGGPTAGTPAPSTGHPSTGPTMTPSGPSHRMSGIPPQRAEAGSTAPSRAGVAHGSVHVVRSITTGLDVPWGLAVLPGDALLVTTRDDARVHRVDVASGHTTLVGTVPGVVSNVRQAGEAGLLGLALSPSFATDHRIYLYWSTASDNRIGWATYSPSARPGRQLGAVHTILTGIPHGVHHNGGRLTFGPDGMLYVGTGESGVPALAQDRGSLGGKILRMTPAGKPAPGNPFGTVVYSYGHRNVQGLAFDSAGRLWASEFGDHTADELNLIKPGRNYGWPATQGRTDDPRYTGPVAQWGTEEDSPSGIAYAAGSIWMAALAGQRLWRIPLDGTRTAAAPEAFLVGTYGRLRSVVALDDHTVVLTTSNRDGRSTPRAGDDRLLLLRVT